MFSEEEAKRIVDLYSKQTKYKSKKEFLKDLKEHLLKNSYENSQTKATAKTK